MSRTQNAVTHPAPVERIQHQSCALCAEDLARYPETICSRCGARYHAECLFRMRCPDPHCSDPLGLDEALVANVPARLASNLPVRAMPKAGCSRRLSAWVLDSGVALLTSLTFAFPAEALGMSAPHVATAALVGVIAAHFLNVVVLTGMRGASVGKKAVGIGVADRRGRAPGILRALIRELPAKMCSQAPWMLGYAMAVVDPENRALHDRLAGTWVIEGSE